MSRILIVLLVISLSLCEISVPLHKKRLPLSQLPVNAKSRQSHNVLNLPTSNVGIYVNLSNYDLEDYYGTIYLGSNPYTFTFDTFGSIMWIPSEFCPEPHTSNPYSCGNSCNITNATLDYDDFNTYVYGNITSDNLTMDGVNVTNMSFLNVFMEDKVPNYLESDGVLGMNVLSMYSSDNMGLMSYLFDQGLIQKRMFGLYQNRINEPENSSIILGGYDKSRGPFEWLPLIDDEVWEVKLDCLRIANTEYRNLGYTAIFDSNFPLMVAPEEALKKYMERLKYYYVDKCYYFTDVGLYGCYVKNMTNTQGFPKMYLRFANHTYSIEKDELVDVVVTYDNRYAALLMVVPTYDSDTWYLGDNFLRGHYLVFDFDNLTVGISGSSYISLVAILMILILFG